MSQDKAECWECSQCHTTNNVSLTLTKYQMQCCLSSCSNQFDPATTLISSSTVWNICPHKQYLENNPCKQCESFINEKNQKCSNNFANCKSAHQIKSALNEYHKLVEHKENKLSQYEFTNKCNILINKKLFDGRYSSLQLLNDFDHLKYDHDIHQNPWQFASFYKYLTGSECVSVCDIKNCVSIQRRYNKSNSRYTTIKNSEQMNNFCLDLLSRIHTYFLHSKDITRLTIVDVKYFEKQLTEYEQKHDDNQMFNDKKLNLLVKIMQKKQKTLSSIVESTKHSKYISSDEEYLDYKKISQILQEYNIFITDDKLENAFDQHGYVKKQLISDLCIGFDNDKKNNILLSQILTNPLQITHKNDMQKIYDILLHSYIDLKELEHDNFKQMLWNVVPKILPDIDIQQFIDICTKHNLSGKIFFKKN
eukprot:27463_1